MNNIGAMGALNHPPTPGPLRSAPATALAPAAGSQGTQAAAQAVDTAAAPTAEQLKNIVAKLQSKASAVAPELRFSVDEDTGKTVVKVSDQRTREIIWQFPSEAALQISKEIDQFQKGLMLNRKV